MKTIRLIKNPQDCQEALARIAQLSGASTGSLEAEEREVLAILVERYQQENALAPASDPVEAIRMVMDLRGLRQVDLVPYLGARSRVTEVLSRKRGLTLEMIRRLHDGLGIPLSCLVAKAEPPRPSPAMNLAGRAKAPAVLVHAPTPEPSPKSRWAVYESIKAPFRK